MVNPWPGGGCEPAVGVLDLMTKPVAGRPRSHWTRLLGEPAHAPCLVHEAHERVVNLDPHAGPRPGTLPPAVAAWIGTLRGLIVSGAEPRGPDLTRDPVHSLIGRILDRTGDLPVLFSCLSAHSALAHLHAVPRVRLAEKRMGVLSHLVVGASPLGRALFPGPVMMPHSRWHTVRRHDLDAAGVHTLLATGADDWGAAHDDEGHLFVQGHPEYGAGTLLREYVRDVGRFVRGEIVAHPTLPVNYLPGEQEQRLRELALLARAGEPVRLPELTMDPSLALAWQGPGRRLLAGWAGRKMETAHV
ncbi:homoserine O-succinyltransferase [Kineosporia sp. J2-2]|uniref:Homoserine O-succinyltransferase n=1 Tax=Kineosporia corallincola TaxID=2835133 RepID=A0ABS5TCE4_9ACTN|nr:homoserine O-succinyltransferase [Kineosporia corallincola]MBT0768730.1 homoserine O-succinyltransferase [Kineosporia corallincola]